MFCSSHRPVAFGILASIALMAACDRGREPAPRIVEVPVAVASASASAAASAVPAVLTEPKRYSEEREHKAAAKVLNADLPVTYEAKSDAVVVTKLAQGVEVARLVDVGEFSLVEYPESTARRQGWVPSAGLQDSAAAPAGTASATVPVATVATAAPTNAVTHPTASSANPAASAKPATSTKPATGASAATAATASSAAPASSGRVRRGRLGR